MTGLLARNCANIQQFLMLKFASRPKKFLGLPRNGFKANNYLGIVFKHKTTRKLHVCYIGTLWDNAKHEFCYLFCYFIISSIYLYYRPFTLYYRFKHIIHKIRYHWIQSQVPPITRYCFLAMYNMLTSWVHCTLQYKQCTFVCSCYSTSHKSL